MARAAGNWTIANDTGLATGAAPKTKYTMYSNHIVRGAFDDALKFPLDCETLAALQNNADICAVLGNIAAASSAGEASPLILTGCKIDGNYRTAGYVWMPTESRPMGEILYHPRQYATPEYGWQIAVVSDSHSQDFPEARPLTADGTPYPNAYSIRYIKDVLPGGSPWSGLAHIEGISNKALDAAIAEEAAARASASEALEERIDGLESSKASRFAISEDVYSDGGASLTGNTYAGKTIVGCYAVWQGVDTGYYWQAKQSGSTITLYGFNCASGQPHAISATGSQSLKQALGVNNGWTAIRIKYIHEISE